MSSLRLAGLALRERRAGMLGLLALAGLFLVVALGSAAFARDPHGGFDLDVFFRLGGTPLVSGILVLGWLLGRFPLIATLVLLAGVVSRDRDTGAARLLAVRPVSRPLLYLTRFGVLAGAAFALSALLLPAFDLLLLGEWAGAGTLALVAANVLVYGGLVTFLSVWTRFDAWIAALLALAALTWHSLLGTGAAVGVPAGAAQFLTFVLPPHGALFALESAFAGVQPVPWAAFAYAAGYGLILLALALIALPRRPL